VARVLSVGAKDVPARVEKLIKDGKAAAKELKKLTIKPAKADGGSVQGGEG